MTFYTWPGVKQGRCGVSGRCRVASSLLPPAGTTSTSARTRALRRNQARTLPRNRRPSRSPAAPKLKGEFRRHAVKGLLQESRRVSMALHSDADEMTGRRWSRVDQRTQHANSGSNRTSRRVATSGIQYQVPKQRVGVIVRQDADAQDRACQVANSLPERRGPAHGCEVGARLPGSRGGKGILGGVPALPASHAAR